MTREARGTAASPLLGDNSGEGDEGVRVELFGVARLAAGHKAVVLPYAQAGSLGEVVGALAERCPALVGPVIAAGGRALVEGHIFNVNGRDFVPDLGAALRPGDTVLLIAAAAGG